VDELASLLGAVLIEVVFVNACHSFDAGQMFLQAGVPYVVAVHSMTKVLDGACVAFAEVFNLSLINGNNVAAAFEHAQQTIRSTKQHTMFSCCCSHAHKPGCQFATSLQRLKWVETHRLHTPDARCTCVDHDDAVHEPTCPVSKRE
jgi:hypothetical protein